MKTNQAIIHQHIIKSSIQIRQIQNQSQNRLQTRPQIQSIVSSLPCSTIIKPQIRKLQLFDLPVSIKKTFKLQKYRKNIFYNNQLNKKNIDLKLNNFQHQYIINNYNPEISNDHSISKISQKYIQAKMKKKAEIKSKRNLSQKYTKSSRESGDSYSLREHKKNILSPLRKGTLLGKKYDNDSHSNIDIGVGCILNINGLKPMRKKQYILKKSGIQQFQNDYNGISKYYQNQRNMIKEKILEVQKKFKQAFQYKLKVIDFSQNKKQSYNITNGQIQKPIPYSSPDSQIKNKRKKITKHKQNYKFTPVLQRYYFRDFLWKICFSNYIYQQILSQYSKPFKVFIGPGNNKMLIRSLFLKRNWWVISQKVDDCHFVWTQIKINQIFQLQKKNKQNVKILKLLSQVFQNQDQRNFSNKDLLNKKILNQKDLQIWNNYFQKNKFLEQKIKQGFQYRNKNLKRKNYTTINSSQLKIHNHLENNYIIGNKKALFYTMCNYYQKISKNVFQFLPLTFHIESGLEDPFYLKFLNAFYQKQKSIKKKQKQLQQKSKNKNIWIVKPGEFTNRGNGITVCLTLQQIKSLIKTRQKHPNGKLKTYIIQQYIQKPFLYQKRKFDIRHYMMITSINGIVRGYWYQQGYIRTTSSQYTLKKNNTGIHLTNDAVQKYLPDYGKYQKGNKISYEEFQKYLDKFYPNKFSFYQTVYSKMKKIATDAIKASFLSIDPNKREHNFQIFGMDFMIDQNFNTWLIQINTNPCLQLSCPLLANIIPNMVQNALRISIDPLFPPPLNLIEKNKSCNQNYLQKNRFELIFDSVNDGDVIKELYNNMNDRYEIKDIQQEDEVYEDEGKQWDS